MENFYLLILLGFVFLAPAKLLSNGAAMPEAFASSHTI
jgi:hypothetical protein